MQHFLNEYFDEIYIVNLKRRPDRLVKVGKKFFDLGIKFNVVEATDGSEPEIQNAFQAYHNCPIGGENAHALEKSYNRKMISSAGAWAYLLTYKRILNKAQEMNARRILCFDDDVVFHKEFNKIIDGSVQSVPQDWKLLYLGATQHVWSFPNALKYPDASLSTYDPTQEYYHPFTTDGSFAVGIDQSVFSILIEEIEKMNCAFDSGPMRRIMQLHQRKCVVLQPNLVIADVTESDIQSGRSQSELSEKLKWDLSLYDVEHDYDLVSVIMPCYNAQKSVVHSVESILNQNYPNVEVIIADDGSTDGTVDVLEKMYAKNSKVKLIKNKQNRGCYFVRNDALRKSKGQFIAVQDTDDHSLKDRLSLQLIPFYTQGVSVTIGRILRAHIDPVEIEKSEEHEIISLARQRRNHRNKNGDFEYCCRYILGFMTTVYRRSVFEEIGLFWEEKHSMDMEFLERLWLHKKGRILKEDENSHEILSNNKHIPDFYTQIDTPVLYSFEMTGDNITNTFKTRKGNKLKELWRARHRNEVEHIYPQWNKEDLDLNSKSFAVRQQYLLERIEKKGAEEREQAIESLKKQLSSSELVPMHLSKETEILKEHSQNCEKKIEWLENEIKLVSRRGREAIAKTKSFYEDGYFLIKRWRE